MASSSCPVTDYRTAWDVRGFYEHKISDPMNFNLDENTVSVITAALTSISLLLFTDIVFRVFVRAKKGRVSKRVVLRRHVLGVSSNPFSLLLMIISVLKTRRSEVHNQTSAQAHKSHWTRWKHVSLSFMGVLAFCIEFLFIFLSTSQRKVYDVRLDAVPVFEFEDRGCNAMFPVEINTCSNQGPITEKAGFDPRAYLQVCTSLSNTPLQLQGVFGSREVILTVVLHTGYGTGVILRDKVHVWNMYTKLGVVLEDGLFFSGLPNVTEEEVLSVLSARLRRANVTVLSATKAQHDPLDLTYTPIAAHLTIDMKRVDFGETVYANVPGIEANVAVARAMYLMGLVNSAIVPSGRGRGMVHRMDKTYFLDEVTTPIVYYIRPWMGIIASIVVCCTLVVGWAVTTALGLKGDVDPRWAWKEFFTDTIGVEDFGKGDDESQEVGWRSKVNGIQTFGFKPTL